MTARFILVASFGLAIVLTYSVFLNIATSFLFLPAFAQDIEDPLTEDPATLNGTDEGQPRLAAIDSDMPMLENMDLGNLVVEMLYCPLLPPASPLDTI